MTREALRRGRDGRSQFRGHAQHVDEQVPWNGGVRRLERDVAGALRAFAPILISFCLGVGSRVPKARKKLPSCRRVKLKVRGEGSKLAQIAPLGARKLWRMAAVEGRPRCGFA